MVSLDKEPKQPNSELLAEEVVESEFKKETRAKRFRSTEVHGISPVSTAAPVFQNRKRYPCHMPTTLSIQREQRILERLQEDKFILKVELYSRLEDLEKDRESTIDRKTLDRTLQRLQQESHCKVIIVSVPLASNCSRKRTTTVILHPSVELSPEILSQIHENLRNFDMQTHGHGQSKFKSVESVPNLTRVSRKQSTEPSNVHSLGGDSMRANGFISAKMVRVKMLHRFLWTHVRGLLYWNGDPFSENHISNCEMTYLPFELDLAVKAMPLELFLQVIGSVKKIKDLDEICRNGVLLCNLPDEEYKNLMDKDATGRFSWLVDVMRRLKLLRLVMVDGNNAIDSSTAAKAVLTHALELKPYIEEPAPSPVVQSLAVNLFDLRPRFRHVFSLFNMEAVDSYWKTLEQCFSVADPAVAARAFPGSSVPEIFFQRSWASVRVMSIEQRSELLKRIASDDLEKQLTARDCKKIAKELNLSLEQVLRVSYEKNRKARLLALQKEANGSTETSKSTIHTHLSKRKRLCHKESTDSEGSEARSKMQSVCQDKTENAIAPSKDTQLANEEVSKEAYSKAGNKHQEQENENENELDDDDGPANAFINRISLLRSKRKKRFPWTEKSDRSLITCYARYRAMAGPRVHCVDWSAITNLPAPPTTCRRRIAALKHMPAIRKAIMNLCELLKLRYLKYLQKCNSQASREGNNEDVSRLVLNNLREKPLEEEKMMHFGELGSQWDDFNDSDILAAIENIMKCRSLFKSSNVKRSSYSSFRLQKQIESAMSKKFICNSPGNGECGTSSILKADNVPHDHFSDTRNSPTCAGTSSSMEISASNRDKSAGVPKSQRCIPKRVQQMLEKNNFSNKRMVRKSLAVANAVELIKLIFLNSTMNTEAPNVLVATLRRYDENDVCAAFNFLRVRGHVVIGHGAQPFVLSQKFFHDASASPFPIGTGERASNLEKWLHENHKELQEDGLILPTDLQCGDLFHLFGLVSSGTFNISPFIPQKGVEEPDTPRGRKRRFDKDVANSESQSPKQNLPSPRDGKLCSRRERGFPGIQVHLIYCAIPVFELISRVFCDTEETAEPVITDDLLNKDYQYKFPDEIDINSEYKYLTSAKLTQEVDSLTRIAEKILHSKESFEEMKTLFHANWFEIIFDAVAKSSEEGLSLDQILQLVGLDTHYIHMVDAIVEALQVFNYVKKVNAFDHVRVISQHKSAPYFLNVHCNDPSGIPAHACDKQSATDGQSIQTISSSESEMHIGNECPIEGQQFSNLKIKKSAQCHQVEPILCENDKKIDKNYEDVQLSPNMYDILKKKKSTNFLEQNRATEDLPIYPWFTADGQTYTSMFKALARRVIGIIMQYPGILEENLIQQLDVLNPQTARKLLELLQLDNHIFVRTICLSSNCNSLPSILRGLIGANCRKEKTLWRRHYYANSRSTSML